MNDWGCFTVITGAMMIAGFAALIWLFLWVMTILV
jgi:hypothetical protein